MLDQLQRNLIPSDRPYPSLEGAAATIDLDTVLAAARRQYKVIAATTVATVLLAIGYIVVATPIYTSTADSSARWTLRATRRTSRSIPRQSKVRSRFSSRRRSRSPLSTS